MKDLFTGCLFLLLSCTAISQTCNPPTNVTLFIDEYWFTSFLDWYPPSSGCDVITYEVEYGYGPFTPGTGEGISYGFIEFPFAEFFDPYVTTVWIRSICDCEGGDEPGEGDGEPDTEGNWVVATVVYIPPPQFPDEGLYCEFAPTIGVSSGLNCGNSFYDLYFNATFEWDGLFDIPCGDGNEYVLWRHFIAPEGGEVEITMSSDGWSEMGYAVFEGECVGASVACNPSVANNETTTVGGLTPGAVYLLASWNVNYPYFYDEWGPNGTINYLELCEPAVDCYSPGNVVINNITNEAAYVTWSANEATQWDLEYGPLGFTPGEGVTISDITTNFTWLEGLDPNTEYDVYIIANCLDLGYSNWNGPSGFMTNPSIWVINDIPDGYAFCCDAFELAEAFDVGTYCEPLNFSFEDEVEGSPCEQIINRTVVATDGCGNQIQVDFEFSIYDNGFECGCESGYQIPDNDDGRAVAIYGEWAIQENGLGDRVMRLVDGEWTLAGTLVLGTNFHNTLQMYDDVFVTHNNVYRLDGDEWTLETTLISSLGDEVATVASVYDHTIALEMGEQIFVFEEIDGEWVEVAMFDQSCYSLDLAEDVLVASGEFDEAIAFVFRKTDGIWALEQELTLPPEAEGSEMGYEVSVDGTHLAIGNRYLGGISIYEFDGAVWQSEGFMMNPNLYSDFGYFTAFGSAIDIEGDLMIVGDNMNQPNGIFSGTVTVFQRACGEWQFQNEIVPIDGQSGHRFGGCLDYHDGNLVVGIDDTYWLGGNPYNGQGKFWFIPCIEASPNDFSFSVSEGGALACGDDIPDPIYELGAAWCADYTVTTEASGSLSCGDEYVLTHTISDGETTQIAEQVFFLEDLVAPQAFDVPQDLSLACDESIPPGEPSFSDDCSDTLEMVFGEEVIAIDCGFQITRTWQATDECDNTTEVQQVIILLDTSPPMAFDTPADQTVSCADPLPQDEPTFTDNCSETITVEYTEELVGNACEHTVTKTWTASDECGNTVVAQQVITVIDEQGPTFECPEPQVLYMNADDELFPTPDFLSGITTLQDNCDENPALGQSPDIGVMIEPGSTIIRIVAIDECGNATICEFEIVVEVIISVDEILDAALVIFPNPAQTQLSFQVFENVVVADVIGMDGKIVSTYAGLPPYDISALSSGKYQLRVRLESGGMAIGNFIKN